MHHPSTWLSFPEYVLRALEHPPHMFVSKLAVCCTMLFLNRSDPELLRILCDKWAARFTMDRPKLIARIRRRSYASRRACSMDCVDEVGEDPLPSPLLCDPDTCVMHFLRLVNTLVPMYFSYNWQKIDTVMRVNKEYEAYVKEELLPMCTHTSAEDGVDNEYEMEFLLPPRSSTDAIAYNGSPRTPFDVPLGVSNDASGFHRSHSSTQQGLSLATIGNIREKMLKSVKGLVLIFHAKYSTKSNDVLALFQEMIWKHLIDPELNICVVHAVAEPELANVYDISWFPTIIFTPQNVGSTQQNIPPSTSSYDLSNDLFAPFTHSPTSHQKEYAQSRAFNGIGVHSLKQIFCVASSSRINEEGSSVPSPISMTKEDGLYRLHQGEGICSLSQEAPTVPPNDLEQTFSEVFYGVPQDPESRSPLRFCSLDDVREDGLRLKILSDGHCVYPASAPITIPALVKWIQSEGKIVIEEVQKESVSHINVLQEANKFKSKRRMSAVVLLREMQNASGGNTSPSQEDAPMFIFLGGGMAAGKSTAAVALSRSSWWAKHKEKSVLVNADDFKVVDPSEDLPAQNENMHALSTRAAEKLLVNAVNAGRSIVFDSTMMWQPFIKQVVDMVRNAHTTIYRQGVGYDPKQGIEEYFVPVMKREVPLPQPYGIHLLAITVEPEIAVPRGILRKFSTGRGVPIPSQLRSFRLFAEAFSQYLDWMDSAKLFNNNVFVDLQKGELPPVIAEKSESTGGNLIIYDANAFDLFKRQRGLYDNADNILELFGSPIE